MTLLRSDVRLLGRRVLCEKTRMDLVHMVGPWPVFGTLFDVDWVESRSLYRRE